jgi:glutathione S-transferase
MPATHTLHHFPLDPASRQVRLALAEKRIGFEETIVRYWEDNPAFSRLNPSGMTPVLVVHGERGETVLCETRAITEWAEETTFDPPLMSADAGERAETRRLVQWFERKFDYEVNALLLHEKVEKRLFGLGAPDTNAVRAGREALKRHLGYIEYLLAERDWLAGDRLSLADLAAAANLSILDYFGEVPWKDFPVAKTWYMKLKCRPCFRSLLSDRQPGMPPADHYDDLDF